MIIKYFIHTSPIYKKTTIFFTSIYSEVGRNLVYLLKEYGYTDLISYTYPLNIPELGITIKGIDYVL